MAASGVLLVAVFLGAVVQGFSGFAFSAVAGAILLQVQTPDLTIPLLMLCSLFIQGFVLLRLRAAMFWRASLPYLAGGGCGVLLATVVFDLIDPHALRVAFGAFLLAYGGWMLLAQSALLVTKPRWGGHIAVGFTGGFLGGLTAMPGAILVIWCDIQGMSKIAQRGVVQPFITTMQTLALALLFLKAPVAQLAVLQTLPIALPALLAGTFLGLHLFGRVGDAGFRKVVCGLLIVSGIGLIW
jgi:uncharacterized protein